MATEVRHRRGTSAQIEAATPAQSEFIHNLTTNRVHVGDGITQGGHPLALVTDISELLIYDTKADVTLAVIPPDAKALRVNGQDTAGDGKGGLYVRTISATSDTVTDSLGTVFYRAADVGMSRLASDVLPLVNIMARNRDAKYFGLKGDDTTNDTVAFNNMIDALASEGGGKVVFPKGRYRLSNPKAITTAGIVLEGEGAGSSVLVDTHATANFIKIGAAATQATENTVIQGLGFQPAVTKTAGAQIYQINAYNSTLADFRIDGTFFKGVSIQRANAGSQYINKVNRFIINGGVFGMTIGEEGTRFEDIVQEVMVGMGTISQASNANLFLGNLSGGFFTDLSILYGRNGVRMEPKAGQRVCASWFTNVLADTNAEHGWFLNTIGNGTITDLFFTQAWASSSGTKPTGGFSNFDGIHVADAANIGTLRFEGLHALNCGGEGFHMGAGELSLTNAAVYVNSRFATGTKPGLHIMGNVKAAQIVGGQFGRGGLFPPTASQNEGIVAETGAGPVIITGADVRGNVGKGIAYGDRDLRIRDCYGFATANSGKVSVTTNAQGIGTITHGLATQPLITSAVLVGNTTMQLQVVAITPTQIQVRLFNPSDNTSIQGTVEVYWTASTAVAP